MNTPAPSSPPRSAWRRLLYVLAALGVLALLVVGLALIALRTEPGARVVWQVASRLAPGQLSGKVIGGTLEGRLKLRDVVYRDEGMVIRIDRIESAWRLLRAPLTLVVDRLHIGTADVTLLPTPPTERKLPQQLTLPLALELRNAGADQLIVHRTGQNLAFGDIRLAGASDGVRHALTLKNAQTPAGSATASLTLDGKRPFSVAGAMRLKGEYREESFQLDASISGSLQALGVHLHASGDKLKGEAVIEATPFARLPFQKLQIDVRNLDPHVFNDKWPRADLDLHAALTPAGNAEDLSQLTVTGPVSLANAIPGPLDRQLLPLVSARAQVRLDAQSQQLEGLNVALPGNAVLEGGGKFGGKGPGSFTLRARRLDLNALNTALVSTSLNGPLTVQFEGEKQHVSADLKGPQLSIAAAATLSPQQLALQSAVLQSGQARLEASGTLGRGANAPFEAQGKLRDFNPARFFSSSGRIKPAAGDIDLDFSMQGELRPQLAAQLRFAARDSTYAGLPLTGSGNLRIAGKRLLQSHAELSVAGNNVLLDGSFGDARDRMTVRIDAPALSRLGFGLSGLLKLDGRIGGSLKRPVVDARYRAEKLAFGQYRVASLSGETQTHGVPGQTPDATVNLELQASGVEAGVVRLERLDAGIDGTYANHRLRLEARGSLRGKPLALDLAAQGNLRELQEGMAWKGTLARLENRGTPRLALGAPLAVAIAPGSVDLASTRLQLAQATIALQNFHVDGQAIRSAGSVTALDLGHLLELRSEFTGEAPPIDTNLVLNGTWDFSLADRADGHIGIERRSGDIRIAGERALGLSALAARLDLRGRQAVLSVQAGATRIGSARAQAEVTLQSVDGRLDLAADAPLSGTVQATIPSLQSAGYLLGPRVSLGGSVELDLALAGSVGDPRVSGSADGRQLAVTLYDHGIRLRDGTARLRLADNIVQLQEVLFRGGEGTLRATGSLPLGEPVRGLNAAITASNLQLLSDPSAQVTISGRAEVAAVDRVPTITGTFTIDRALVSLPETPAPRLDDDVIVIRGGKRRERPATGGEKIIAATQKAASPFSPRVDVLLNLGNNFRFVGSGAEVLLAGALNIESTPGEQLRAYGAVRVVEGTYEAYGAELAIERGVINFQGPVRNPNINILAMRRNQEVEAGVQVTGTVQRPRVQLVSQPNVPNEEKLSWLVFGRAPGAEAGPPSSLGRSAAVGLLNKFGGKRLAQGLGLDVVSIGESEFGLAGQQVVNLGKEISDRLYIGFEQSLAGTESVLKLTYELSRQWSIVLRGGTIAGIDIFFSRRFDSLR